MADGVTQPVPRILNPLFNLTNNMLANDNTSWERLCTEAMHIVTTTVFSPHKIKPYSQPYGRMWNVIGILRSAINHNNSGRAAIDFEVDFAQMTADANAHFDYDRNSDVVELFEHLTRSTDPMFSRDPKFIIKPNPALKDADWLIDNICGQINVLQSQPIYAKAFEMFLPEGPEADEVRRASYTPKNHLMISHMLEKTSKLLRKPFQCVTHMIGWEKMNAVKEHIQMYHNDYIEDFVRNRNREKRIEQAKQEQCDHDQRIHDQNHPTCGCQFEPVEANR